MAVADKVVCETIAAKKENLPAKCFVKFLKNNRFCAASSFKNCCQDPTLPTFIARGAKCVVDFVVWPQADMKKVVSAGRVNNVNLETEVDDHLPVGIEFVHSQGAKDTWFHRRKLGYDRKKFDNQISWLQCNMTST